VVDLVPLYALYAVMFAEHGLTDAQISTLFLVWSSVGILTEVPTGAIADRFSRRGALVSSGVLQAAGYAVWIMFPGFTGYAAGFVLWGLGGALSSGSLEALVYDGLAVLDATEQFPRLLGRITAAGMIAQLPAALAATVLFGWGGYWLVGWVSVGCCLTAAALALMLRDARPGEPESDDQQAPALGYFATLRVGVAEAVTRPEVRIMVLVVAVMEGLDALEEYFTLVALDWGVPVEWVPIAVLAIPLVGAAGAWWGTRRPMSGRSPSRTLALALAVAALLLALSDWFGKPAGLVGVAAFYGLYRLVLVAVSSRLQDRIEGGSRATISSVASLGSEFAAIAVYGLWAVGGLALVALMVLCVAVILPRAWRGARPGLRRFSWDDRH
jgi:MFS family permease